MGAWGPGPFDNDDALDWLADVTASDDPTSLEAAFAHVDSSATTIDSPSCAAAIAAAEIVATIARRPMGDLPEDATVCAGRFAGVFSPTLLAKARVAVGCIRRASELRDLWLDSSHFSRWESSVRDLEHRLLDMT
jgi:hypothetical protein